MTKSEAGRLGEAVSHYLAHDYRLIPNGDSEEAWQSNYKNIANRYGKTLLIIEKRFLEKGRDYYIRLFGSHDYDLNDLQNVKSHIANFFSGVKVHEALCMGNDVVISHGHQGQ